MGNAEVNGVPLVLNRLDDLDLAWYRLCILIFDPSTILQSPCYPSLNVSCFAV